MQTVEDPDFAVYDVPPVAGDVSSGGVKRLGLTVSLEVWKDGKKECGRARRK